MRKAISIVLIGVLMPWFITPVFADDEQLAGEQAKLEYEALGTGIQRLGLDVSATRKGFESNYLCSPAQPNKDAARNELDRLNNLRFDYQTRLRRLSMQLESGRVGRAGRGEINSGTVDYPDLEQLQRQLTQISQAIGLARTELRNIRIKDEDCEFGTLSTFTFSPASHLPGAVVAAPITATSTRGKPMVITNVGITGINGFFGSRMPTNGLGTRNATAQFRIDDVRRQGPFPIMVTVVAVEVGAPPGTPATRRSQRFYYRVANDHPQIVGTIDSVSAEPGQAMTAVWEISVIDRNADSNNAREIVANSLGFAAHPQELQTQPTAAFQRFTTTTLLDHEPSTGTYRFRVERSAQLAYSHRHGTFSTRININDQEGAEGSAAVDFIVENVPPEGRLNISPKTDYHADDGIPVAITGRVTDGNGRLDIESIDIDAREAGGANYDWQRTDVGDIVMTARHDDGWSFRINPATFAHTRNPGEHKIRATVRDNGAPEQNQPQPLQVDFPAAINIGNKPPTMTATGFIYQSGLNEERRLCPRQLFEVGSNAHDAEGDELQVTAQIVGQGAPEAMQIQPGESSYTLHLLAPQQPGRYTLLIRAVEMNIVPPASTEKKLVLIVEPCNDNEQLTSNEPQVPEADIIGDRIKPDDLPLVSVFAKPGSSIKVIPADIPSLPTLISEEGKNAVKKLIDAYESEGEINEEMLDWDFELREAMERIGIGGSGNYRLLEDSANDCGSGPTPGIEFEATESEDSIKVIKPGSTGARKTETGNKTSDDSVVVYDNWRNRIAIAHDPNATPKNQSGLGLVMPTNMIWRTQYKLLILNIVIGFVNANEPPTLNPVKDMLNTIQLVQSLQLLAILIHHNAGAMQGVTGEDGQVDLQGPHYFDTLNNRDIHLQGGGAKHSLFFESSGGNFPIVPVDHYAVPFSIDGINYQSIFVAEEDEEELYASPSFTGLELAHNACRNKAFGPFGVWQSVLTSKTTGTAYSSATLRLHVQKKGEKQ